MKMKLLRIFPYLWYYFLYFFNKKEVFGKSMIHICLKLKYRANVSEEKQKYLVYPRIYSIGSSDGLSLFSDKFPPSLRQEKQDLH